MEKIFIQNRKGEKVAVIVDQLQGKAKGLVFIVHGHGAFKEQSQIVTIADAFIENNYTVVRFDEDNATGETESSYEYSTVTSYYENLDAVINWAKLQTWYQEPFVLVGSSLGAMCVALYAENNPEKVKALAPKATVVSWELSLPTYDPEQMAEWEKTGWKIETSISKPGHIKKLNWPNFKKEGQKYNLLDKVSQLTMPVLFVVGEKDTSCPPENQKILFDQTPGLKEFHIIKNAPHTFREAEHLNELKQIFDQWIKKL